MNTFIAWYQGDRNVAYDFAALLEIKQMKIIALCRLQTLPTRLWVYLSGAPAQNWAMRKPLKRYIWAGVGVLYHVLLTVGT